MSKFSTLYRGELDDVYDILDSQSCSEQELRAALQNAILTIKSLKKRIENLERGGK